VVFTERTFSVTNGSIDGVAVHGFLYHDVMHLPSGVEWMSTTTARVGEQGWLTFATEYDDDEREHGIVLWGHDGLSAMIVHRSDGTCLVTHDFEVDVAVDEDGFATRTDVRAAGEQWTWRSLGHRFPKQRGNVRANWAEGVVTRSGDTRPWHRCEGFMELIERDAPGIAG
jgi:hypothetical protein